jgi:hypothetical protein
MSRDNLVKVRAKIALAYARATLLKAQDLLQMSRELRSQEQKRTRAYRLRKELRLLKSLLLADPDCPAPAARRAHSGEASAAGRRRGALRCGKTRKVRAHPVREADPALR